MVDFASGAGPTRPAHGPREAAWEAQLARLAAYKAAHGDCNVPNRWAEDPPLGKWVGTQRHYKRKLDRGEPSQGMTAERVVWLTALDFAWGGLKGPPPQVAWGLQLARLAAYKAAHGDCNVPKCWAKDPGLGTWVNHQRWYKQQHDRGEPIHRMTADRVARLTALGFVWDQHEAEWEAQLAQLAAYTAVHGDRSVPRGWAEDPRLGTWVMNQRSVERGVEELTAQLAEHSHGWTEPGAIVPAAKRRRVRGAAPLTPLSGTFCRRSQPRVPPLAAAGDDGRGRGVATSAAVGAELAVDFASGPGPTRPAHGPREAAWEAQLARLAAYKAARGDCSVPQGTHPPLGTWVSNQRALKRKLDRGEHSFGMTAERAARLTALGLVWNPGHDPSSAPQRDAKWEAQLARLAAYKAVHGDCNVPDRWAEDPRLVNWVSTQRQLKRRLDRGEPSLGMTAERAARLTALDFVWVQHARA
jgi:hypothetical protein